jgi:isoleucyl-tRNA synthetase
MLELQRVTSGVTFQLDNYNTVKAAKLLVDFINDLSTWYVRRSRSRIKADGQEALEAKETFGYVLAESAKLFAPFMPFLAERIYRDVTGKESVHLVSWPKVSENIEVDPLLAEMDIVREIVSIGHNVRKDLVLPVRQPLRAIAVALKDSKHELAEDLLAIALEELNVKVIDSALSDKAGLRPETIKTFSGSQNIAKFYLDLEITPELALEGLARELERQVQDLRKKSGLQIGELVDLYYNTTDSQLEVVTTTLLDRKKTFVNQVSKSLEVEVDFEIQAEVGGQPIWLGLVKV